MPCYTVEEPQETEASELTADEILHKAGFAPKHFYLVEIRHHERISYEGKGHHKIPIREGAKFICIHIGPTPVSDLPPAGLQRMLAELASLGFETSASNAAGFCFQYEVDVGKFAGRKFTIGLQPPPDYPLNPPSGIHVSPTIHAPQSGGSHPTGGILESPFGAAFQYWSRPCSDWAQTRRRACDYLAFVRQLWASQ